MEVSCAFPTALDSPDNIALAEQLGYARAWVYDTAQQSPDVWMTLALAAERTERIGLGPGERATLSGTPGAIRDRIAELAAHGVTEIVYQLCGPDLRGELERFLAAATGGKSA